MDATQKMLQTVINGQSSMKSELLVEIKKLSIRIDNLDKKFSSKLDNLDKNLSRRIDILGKDIANLEDDAPTIEEFDKLEKRVTKVEQKVASA